MARLLACEPARIPEAGLVVAARSRFGPSDAISSDKRIVRRNARLTVYLCDLYEEHTSESFSFELMLVPDFPASGPGTG